jgi:hypothetical protein
MENDIHQVCREKQEILIREVLDQFLLLRYAFLVKVEKKEDQFSEFLDKAPGHERVSDDVSGRWKDMSRDLERQQTFSSYIEKLDATLGAWIHDIGVFKIEVDNSIPSSGIFPPLNDQKKYLDPNFQFSEDIEKFLCEFLELYGEYRDSCNSNEPSDPRIDLALSKALFQAGLLIGKLQQQGFEKSDKKSKMGSRPKKTRYSDDDIEAAFYKCEEKRMWPMQNAIWSFLNDQKKRTNSEKDVPSTSTIKRTLEKKGLDKKLAK